MKRFFAGVLFCGILAAPSLLAQNEASKTENSGATNAPPEKDLTGWQWANFVVLAVGLGYLGVKMGGSYFRGQSQKIGQGLDEARQQKVRAEVRASEVNRKLENLGEDIESLRRNVLRDQAAQIDRMRKQAEIEISRVYANASQQIEMAGKQARLELQRYAANLALELARQQARQRMTPDVQRALTSQFVESLRA